MTDQSTFEQTTPTADDLGKCVAGLVNAVARGTEEQLEPWGFSALDFSLLGVCHSAGTTTVTELAEVIPIDSGRISRIVNKLYNRGLISRQRMASDRRVVKLQLSDDGLDLVPRLVQLVENYNKTLLTGISVEDQARFVAICHKIIENHIRHQAERAAQAP